MKDIYETGLQKGQLRGGLNCVLASDNSDQQPEVAVQVLAFVAISEPWINKLQQPEGQIDFERVTGTGIKVNK